MGLLPDKPSRACRDACRDRKLTVSFVSEAGKNVPGIPGACTTRNFTYLAKGPWGEQSPMRT